VYHAIHDYCVVDLSAFYFDVLKDRLYTKAAKNKSRRSAQTAVWKISSALVRLAAPVLVFTTEEIWKYLPKAPGEPESVHMAVFPEAMEMEAGLDFNTKGLWNSLREVRAVVLSALEVARNSKLISSALEAKVVLSVDSEHPELLKLIREYKTELPALFIVSQVSLREEPIADAFQSDVLRGLSVKIERADGKKCERCWNYSTRVGENARYPTVCERCSEALAEIESTRAGAAQ
jgi:isoleucyl-tRNA synthetase